MRGTGYSLPCTKCGGPTRVVDSRQSRHPELKKIPTVRRRRACRSCGFRFTTHEGMFNLADYESRVKRISIWSKSIADLAERMMQL